MMRWVAVTAIVSGMWLAGCAAPGAISSPAAVATRDDGFLPYREIATTSFEAVQPGGDRVRGHLAARRDKTTGTLATHAALGVIYGGKKSRHYEAARNNRAELLAFRRLYHDGTGCKRGAVCAQAELFQVEIPESDLRRALMAGEDYPIKLFDRAGRNTLFPIPKELVAALFKEIDAGVPATVADQRRRNE